MSLPLRERGLKSFIPVLLCPSPAVAPLAGAWIEIYTQRQALRRILWSLPLRERGLKLTVIVSGCAVLSVAPLAGAWIEIRSTAVPFPVEPSRSPCGSVD